MTETVPHWIIISHVCALPHVADVAHGLVPSISSARHDTRNERGERAKRESSQRAYYERSSGNSSSEGGPEEGSSSLLLSTSTDAAARPTTPSPTALPTRLITPLMPVFF